ncbi:MAG: AAA family ATPase [Burkholderiales bacterium]
MSAGKRILIIAGPNGAGKSTFANEYLVQDAHCPVFVNADLIAAGLSPFQPERAAMRAGRIMLKEIRHNVECGTTFGFETTLSGRGYARMIPGWQAAGYHVKLIFLSLRSPALAVARVAMRVRQGGHGIPEAVIRRRFESGLANFHGIYSNLVDTWVLYDNSGPGFKMIAWSDPQ